MLKTTVLLLCVACCPAAVVASTSHGNESVDGGPKCRNGLILPKWPGDDILSVGDRISRGLIYFIALCYLFVGVSIVADRFMAAIEVITSQEKEITLKRPNGETQTVVVRIWNETVANLTLMALGSSAPEILLSIIEICGTRFEAGDLGPGTIVGSAAFNLFIIISVCVYVIPDGESRKIKHLRVFFITATWSIFAYIWLYIILSCTSPGVIDVWEGLLTFTFFPLTVLTAYIADRRLLIYKYLSKSYRMNKRGVIVEGEGTGGDVEMAVSKVNHVSNDANFKNRFDVDDNVDSEIKDFEEHRREYIEILRDVRRKNPDCDLETIEAMAMEEILNKGPKSRAFYRIQATRKLTGGGNVLKRTKEKFESCHELMKQAEKEDDEGLTKVYFDPGHYTVMENVGEFWVTVTRQGGDLNSTVLVDYKTEDGTANAESDYVYAEGTLTFHPGETHKQITLSVIDDDVFEEDEHFYVRLSNLRLQPTSTLVVNGFNTNRRNSRVPLSPSLQLASPSLATVMILDDDHAGVFSFAEKEMEVPESIGQMQIFVNRFSGARGRVVLPFRTIDGTAKSGKDFEPVEGEIIFEDNETDKCILVNIMEEDSYEKDVIFFVELGEPVQINDGDSGSFRLKPELNGINNEEEQIALLGKPTLGETTKTQIRIKESKEFKHTVDKLIKMGNVSLMVGTSSWKEQFVEAITVSAGDDDDDEDGGGEKDDDEIKMPSCSDYILHFITIFWKVLFATIPPTDYLDGWLCFIVSILVIGLLTAFIGDVASHFGCSVGLRDSVTAISFVALGTSLPDTFASKVAAINDEYADSSIGNVTGSNAVNVFLGLGIAWSMAAIYHAYNGTVFYVNPGSLAYSVTLFCTMALVAIGILLFRRTKRFGGELGGPRGTKLATTFIFIFFWVVYIVLSSLEMYRIIPGF
ncbi:hypothetical protein CHUAL_008901 [Chamberlinius hualienensis]